MIYEFISRIPSFKDSLTFRKYRPFDMKYSNFIAIFVFLQIIVKCRSASIPKNSGVFWLTEELPTVQIPNNGSQHLGTSLEAKIRELLKIAEEMKDDIEKMYADESSSPGIPCGNEAQEKVKTDYTNYYKGQLTKVLELAGRSPLGKSAQDQELDALRSILIKAEERRRTYTYQPRIKSVYPICNDSNVVKDKIAQNISILFDPDTLQPPTNMYLDVLFATMNIYKIGYHNSTIPRNKNITVNLSCLKGSKKNSPNSTKVGRKLGLIQTTVDEERWMQWNITKWVQDWFNNSTMFKYWITIKVADDQEHFPAFFTINCSKITAVNEGNRDRRSSISVDKEIPYMNVTIKEIPKKDREFNNKEQKLINGVIALKNKIRSGSDTSVSSEQKSSLIKRNKQSEEVTDSTFDQSDTST